MQSDQLVIDVSGLSKSFRKSKAVLDVTLQVKQGEILGFLGPNGCGKTTTIRMLSGLLTPETGSGFCMGFDIIKQARQIREHVGYVTQYFSLYEDLTVYENLNFRARLYGMSDYEKRIESVVAIMGFEQRRNQLAKALSGGWKQRLSLAAALLNSPMLLLLDEPNAGVDPSSRRTFWEVVNVLSSRGTTVLLSSHDMSEVERCHRISYMNAGKLMMVGTIDEIISKISLSTWEVFGPNLSLLTRQLRATPGIEQVNPSYNKLRVSSKDAGVLEAAVLPYTKNHNYRWDKVNSGLEDAFIWLTNSVADTRYVK